MSDDARRRPQALSTVAEINITPLIDVMLVLLIIFMLVSPAARRSLDTALPKPARSASPSPPPAIVLTVAGSGLSLDREPVVDPSALETRLREVFAARQDKTLFVRAEDTVVYRRVVEALDAAKGAGVERIGMIPAISEPAVP